MLSGVETHWGKIICRSVKMVSYAKILFFYALIGIMVFGAYMERDFLIGLSDPKPVFDLANEQKTAVEKKIAEVKGAIEKGLKKNAIDFDLDKTVTETKSQIEKKIASVNLGGNQTGPGGETKKTAKEIIPDTSSKTGIVDKTDALAIDEQPPAIKEKEVAVAGLTVAGVIALTNRERALNLGDGHSLAESSILDQAASYRLQDMFAKQYFAHESPDGLKMGYFLEKAGYDSLASGENLAEGDFSGDPDLVEGWMNSPGHRANILNATYNEIGVAVGRGQFQGRTAWVAVQMLGTPSTACAKPDEELEIRFNSLKTELDHIKSELSTMSATIDSLKTEAEASKENISGLIDSGRDSEAATEQEDLNLLIDRINEQVSAYNLKVAEQKRIYGEYQTNVVLYNGQIKEFNACLNAL